MSSQFHNRLVGTVVLVALGVIFLPDILDGKKDRQEEQFSEIPLRPTVIEQQKADDDMFEVLSAEDTAALSGADATLAEAGNNADSDKSAALVIAKQDVKADVKAEVKKPEVKQAEVKKPEVKPEPKKEPPKATVKTEPAKKTETKAPTVAKTEKPKAETPKASTASRDNLKSGFTLQLGSFNNATNVKALIAQLRKSGFKAYTIPENPKDGVLTKVFVGPDVSEAKLKKIQVEVENLTRLKGWIVPFNPSES